MKKILCTFLVSTLTLSGLSVTQAATIDNQTGAKIYPISGRSGVIYEDESAATPFMTPNSIFSISYSVSAGGYMDSSNASGKYLTVDDISNDVVCVDSKPSSGNKSGSMGVGLGYMSDWADNVLVTSGNEITFTTNKAATKYIYSPDLSEEKYYAVVDNDSSNAISGKLIFNDLV